MTDSPARLSLIGLGKLGTPMAALFAAKGFEVIGVDSDAAKVEALCRGESPVREPGVEACLEEASGRLRATKDMCAAVAESDVTFLIVPTPSEAHGGFSLRYVLAACDEIGAALREKKGDHLVVLASTVMPGATGGPVREALEASSGRRVGRDLGLCYSPEFIALGSVLRDYLNPDFVLIGQSDPGAGDRLQALYRRVHQNDPPVARLSFVDAELAKLAVNSFVTARITFANTLSGICEQLPGADAHAVTAAVGLDSRIGSRYLKGALPFGGPCFPRDNAALAALAHSVGVPAHLPEANMHANSAELLRWVALVRAHVRPGERVGVLGLSYKTDTDVVEESPGLKIAQALAADGIPVVAFDPAAGRNAERVLGERVPLVASAADCAARSQVLVVATPWEEFRALASSLQGSSVRVVVDCWRRFEAGALPEGIEHVRAGMGPAPEED